MMPLIRSCLALAVCFAAAGAVGNATQSVPPTGPERVASAPPDPSRLFLDALQERSGSREEALRALTAAALAPEPSARHVLHCGLAHLWAAVEGPVGTAATHEHAVLAAHWLARAAALRPDDHRIGGWQASAATIIALIERDEARAAAARADLERLAIEDPCFHAITLAPALFDSDRGSPGFAKLRTAMEESFACGMRGEIGDGTRWPHAVAGFLVALSDVRLKAGDLAGAESALVVAEARESTASWQHRRVLEERIATLRERAARYATPDPADDPPFILGGGGAGCRICHAVGAGRP